MMNSVLTRQANSCSKNKYPFLLKLATTGSINAFVLQFYDLILPFIMDCIRENIIVFLYSNNLLRFVITTQRISHTHEKFA
jgi:hypothetical protein